MSNEGSRLPIDFDLGQISHEMDDWESSCTVKYTVDQ